MLECAVFWIFLRNFVSDNRCLVQEFLSYRFSVPVFILTCQAVAVTSCGSRREYCTKIHAGAPGGRNVMETVTLQVCLTACGQSIEFRWARQRPHHPPGRSHNCWQLIEFLGVDGVQLWVAQSILKRTWTEQWSRTHKLSICTAFLCCSVQHCVLANRIVDRLLWITGVRALS